MWFNYDDHNLTMKCFQLLFSQLKFAKIILHYHLSSKRSMDYDLIIIKIIGFMKIILDWPN